ncbi:MAG: rhodanese-like domain-containing protein [Gaiellaceae bacterium]
MGLFARTDHVDAEAVAERLADRTVVVVDVRQPAEWCRGHIGGSLNLPLPQLATRLHRLPKDTTIVAVCASGHRSAVATRTLQRAGYRTENLKGGMRSWSRAGLPLETSR